MEGNLVQEIAASVRVHKAQLDMLNAHLNQMQRQKQVAKLTAEEIGSYPVDTIWRSCGKMFILQQKQTYTKQLSKEQGMIDEQIQALETKKQYLETSVDKAVDALKKAVGQQ